jgi:hypothetical protein
MYILYTIFVFPTHVALQGKCSSMYIIMHIGKGGGGECLPTTQIPAYPTLSSPSPESLLLLSAGRGSTGYSRRWAYDHFLSSPSPESLLLLLVERLREKGQYSQ